MLADSYLAVSDPEGKGLYTFDTGILIGGLLDLYLMCHDDYYLEEIQKRIEWLLSVFDGRRFPAVVAYDDDHRDSGRAWHRITSVHLAKLAIPLLKGWKVIGNEAYREAACTLLDWAITLQRPEGSFSINETNAATMLHPHCYATEGFLYAGKILDSQRYMDVAVRASRWLESVQNTDGSFFRWLPSVPGSLARRGFNALVKTTTTDATAQAVRIWKLLRQNPAGINQAQRYLRQMTYDGGLRLSSRRTGFMELRRRKIYSWPSFFYLHACSIAHGEFDKVDELF
jgi:hypothetical protein